MRFFLPLFFLAWFPFLVDGKTFTAEVDETRPLTATGVVEVANVNGAVTIATWDKPAVHIVAVKEARSESDLAALEVKIDAGPERVSVRTNYLEKDGSWLKKFTNTAEVRYTITVPRTAHLKKVETVNGGVDITDAHGRVKASSVNGRVSGRGLHHEVEFSTVNGSVVAAFATIADKQDIRLEAVNGSIELTLPADASAEVRASTVNGRISNDFGLASGNDRWIGRDLDGRLGGGAGRIKLHTVNGPIKILKQAPEGSLKVER